MDNKRLVLGPRRHRRLRDRVGLARARGLIREYDIRADELTTTRAGRRRAGARRDAARLRARRRRGERFVASSDIIETFAARFDTQITLGGHVRAGGDRACGPSASTVHVHLVSIDDHVRRLLPEGVRVHLLAPSEDSTDPHLIVQFGAGVRVTAGDIDFTAPHPNRIIYANDPPNRELVMREELGDALSTARRVPGGRVQRHPGRGAARGAARAHRCGHRTGLPAGSLVFYEDAGYHIPAFSRRGCATGSSTASTCTA